MSAPGIQAPAAAAAKSVAGAWPQVQAKLVVLRGLLARGVAIGWSSLLVLVLIIRTGIRWQSWCEHTGLARRKTMGRGDQRKDVLVGVPRLAGWSANPYGARLRVKLAIGQDVDDFRQRLGPLRHTLKIQSARARQFERKPGFVELDLLRKDPLDQVRHHPRALGLDRFQIGSTEHGDRYVRDFETQPHGLTSGGTGSGKSGWLLALEEAIAETDAIIVNWDLKWALEARVMAPRSSAICDDRKSVKSSADYLIYLAETRARMFAEFGCRSITEFEERTGVHLRRVHLIVDEVAELGMDTPLEDDPTADEVLTQLLRIVQLVRAMGIHATVCGQRFGSDMGKKVTSIRAQISGRTCLAVNDKETAQMVLPGMDPEVHSRAMGINRPGLAIQPVTDQDWYYARVPYRSYDQARSTADTYAYHAIPLDQVHEDDRARTTHLYEGRG